PLHQIRIHCLQSFPLQLHHSSNNRSHFPAENKSSLQIAAKGLLIPFLRLYWRNPFRHFDTREHSYNQNDNNTLYALYLPLIRRNTSVEYPAALALFRTIPYRWARIPLRPLVRPFYKSNTPQSKRHHLANKNRKNRFHQFQAQIRTRLFLRLHIQSPTIHETDILL